MITHLLVDLDGTLLGASNFKARVEFTVRILNRLRRFLGWRGAVTSLHAVNEALKSEPCGVTNEKKATQALAKTAGMAEDEASRIFREVVSEVFPPLKRHFFPIQGAADFLHWAKDRFRLILATNPVWALEIIELRLKWAGLDPSLFDKITHAGCMSACKPSPQFYRELLQQERLKPESCLLVGNEMRMDYPAVHVGVPVYILTPKLTTKQIPVPKNAAPAWKGGYEGLKELLT